MKGAEEEKGVGEGVKDGKRACVRDKGTHKGVPRVNWEYVRCFPLSKPRALLRKIVIKG